MYKCVFEVQDYDSPYYSWDDVEKEFETLEEARQWSLDNSCNREGYRLVYVSKDGKEVDFNTYFMEVDYGFERLQENLIHQMNDFIKKIERCETIKDLQQMNVLWLYPTLGLEKK